MNYFIIYNIKVNIAYIKNGVKDHQTLLLSLLFIERMLRRSTTLNEKFKHRSQNAYTKRIPYSERRSLPHNLMVCSKYFLARSRL